MQIISSQLYIKIPELVFGFSTKVGLNRSAPFCFNLSFTVGDIESAVKENRESFYNKLGLTSDNVATQMQVHSDIISIVERGGYVGESDALITSKKGIGLAISSADCTPVFIYDKKKSLAAAVHSGWRGTQKRILEKTLVKLSTEFGSRAEDLAVYIGPSIAQRNYIVGREVSELFDEKYILLKNGSIYLDVLGMNRDMLLNYGVSEGQIEISSLCSFEEKDLLHSFRRDGKNSGRGLGIIAIKGMN